MDSEVIEVIGRYIEVQPGVFEWEGADPGTVIRLWRPAGRYHLLDGTISDHPRVTVPYEAATDDELIGAAAIGATLTMPGFMAAWQGLTREQRREVGKLAGEAARGTFIALTRSRRKTPKPRPTGTPTEQEV